MTIKTTDKVVSLQEMREEKIEERRRQYERVMFKNSLGVYTVIEHRGLFPIELVDISEGGLSFQVPERTHLELAKNEQLTLRLYFTNDSFINIHVKVVREIPAIEQGVAYRRFGCLVDKTVSSYSAVFHFVQFIAKCAEHAHKDEGTLKVFY